MNDIPNIRIRHPEKVKNPDTPRQRKPDWIRVKAPSGEGYIKTRNILRENKLVTVCEEAGCPNVGECWNQGHATMMIMGGICTRACTFCNIATGKPEGGLDPFEPARVADAVFKLGLHHVVITSVDRDDIKDGGAQHFAQTIRAIRNKCGKTSIEVLTPDFLNCEASALEEVVAAKPDVFNHNLETVPGLYPEVRPGARYYHSLRLLQRVKMKMRSSSFDIRSDIDMPNMYLNNLLTRLTINENRYLRTKPFGSSLFVVMQKIDNQDANFSV